MKHKYLSSLFLLFIFLYGSPGFSTVRVAFFEAYNRDGSRVELTPGGKFFHVAIEIEGYWYHTSTKEGVVQLRGISPQAGVKLVEILENRDLEITHRDLRPYLFLPFDYTYSWEKENSTYCSKFVAQLLGVKPKRMGFKSSHWRLAHGVKKGYRGVSPDFLYWQLIQKGFEISEEPLLRRREPLLCKRLFR